MPQGASKVRIRSATRRLVRRLQLSGANGAPSSADAPSFLTIRPHSAPRGLNFLTSVAMNTDTRFRLFLLTLGVALIAACGGDGSNDPDPNDPGDGEVHEGRRLALDESGIRALRDGDGFRVEIPVEALGEGEQVIDGNVVIRTLAGDELATVDGLDRLVNAQGLVGERGDLGDVGLVGERGTAIFLLPAIDGLPESTLDSGALADMVIDYTITSDGTRLYGHRSLFTAWQKQSVNVFSTDTFDVDGSSFVRVIATDPATGEPIVGADVRVAFRDADGNVAEVPNTCFARTESGQEATDCRTDEFGMVAVQVEPDETVVGDRELVVDIEAAGGVHETVAAAVAVGREQRVMITTDKPLYQPGQTIHLRTLTLGSRTLEPSADEAVLIEIKDAEGNKVGRIELETDDFGIAAGEFVLANELNMGTWTIAATVDGVTTERAVTVERYVLPKFNVVAQPDREYYAPGDTIEMFIDAQYFFGQPVANGAVLVEPYTFDVGFNPLPPVEADLDASGITRVEVPVPDFLVGLPLEQGGTFLRVDVSVTDATEHTQTISRSLPIVNGDLVVTVVPAGSIVPGVANTFYVITSDPVGRATPASCELTFGDASLEFETNARGMGEITVQPAEGTTSLDFSISATADDRTASRDFSFDTGFAAEHGAISLRTDAAVYAVGDLIEYSIVTGSAVPRVFLDVIRSGQTLKTQTIELEDGRAEGVIQVTADMTGTLKIDAYLVTTDANVVRGDALVWVEDANALDVVFSTPEDIYRPGEEGQIDVRVTDEDGAGVVAAVGMTVVDEAVFALQDMRPGLERIYFQIEEELLNPQYNLYNLSFESVIAPPEDVTPEERDAAAAVLLAATESGGYPIALDTLTPAVTAARSIASAFFNTDANRIADKFHVLFDMERFDWDTWQSRAEAEQLLAQVSVPYDAWGRRMTLELEGQDDNIWAVVARSAGLDEVWDTDDDLSRRFETWELTYGAQNGGDRGDWDDNFDGPAMDAGAGPPEEPMPGTDPSEGGGDEGGSDAPRVREYFPETLLVEPALITDGDGNASVPVTMADSITTWRVTGTANTAAGQLGSGTGAVTVFQEFFVDINFPVSLTQNDIVSVPVALFNYLDEPQTVELTVDLEASGDWFTLLSDSDLTVELDGGEITVRYFDVQVDRVGWRPFQVTAIGSTMSDAIRRVVEVVPDGQEQLVVYSDRLVDDVARTVTIPAEAIDEASALFVKLYPGLFSQVIEGLDSLLQMPSGCFEQTSSTTYPNILVMQYLLESGTSSPEIEMLATEYISQGYQRLVSYEVPGGGFEWFGNDPAHRILTAYGLLEFSDMAEVFPVDPAILERTRAWLLSQQESDGRWRAAPEGIHEGATNNFQDSDVRATAYIAYALLQSGDTSAATLRGVDWVRSNLSGVDDPYSLGLVANMLLSADRSDTLARQILDDLNDAKMSEDTDSGPVYWWESASQSLYYGSGEAMNMETTAFILQAFILSGAYPDTVDGVVGYLIQNKGEFGQFSSTQATIHSLRAFIMLLTEATTSGAADIAVYLGDALIEEVSIDAESSDLMRLFDLREYVVEGDNDVRIEIEGEGQFLYQVIGRYYLPWEEVPGPSEDIIAIDVAYDRTELEVDQLVNVTATVTNNSGGRLDMVMVDLGVPPGFEVQMSDFQRYIEDETNPITRVERAGRQLTVYVYGLDAAEELVMEYALQATMPMEAATPPSAAWLYYDNGVRSEEEPVVLTVR